MTLSSLTQQDKVKNCEHIYQVENIIPFGMFGNIFEIECMKCKYKITAFQSPKLTLSLNKHETI